MSLFSFKDVCQDVTKTATKIPTSEYLEKGKYEIFDQGKSYVAGYTNNSLGIANEFPYIVFGDHTRVVKYVDVPCFIGADGVKLLKVNNSNFDSKYVYYTLLNFPITSQGYSRHFKYLKECVFVERSLVEQNRIVAELDKIQGAIDNKRQQLAKLDELVNSKFYEMFGDPIANPKDWETKKIGEFAQCIAGATPSTKKNEYWENGDIPWLSSGEVSKGRIYDTEKKITQLGYDNSSTKLIPPHSVLIALAGQGKTRGTVGIAEIQLCTNQSICSIINPSEIICVNFLYYYLKSKYDELRAISNGDGGRGGLNLKLISNFKVLIPPLELQEQFANFAQKIEQAKDVVSKQIDYLQELLDSRMDFYFRQ